MDSIPDIDDKCQDVKGLQKFAGCPDTDNGGIIDLDDLCPVDSGLPVFKGCPDFDGDSIPDLEDSCVTEKGSIDFHGCPDSDGDLIINKLDSCPFAKGPTSNNGCPIIEKVKIEPEPIKNIPTKEEQEANYNLKLSKNRAEAVKKYIEEKGVDGIRITATGFELSRPVITNKVSEGRQKHRRVEFTIE